MRMSKKVIALFLSLTFALSMVYIPVAVADDSLSPIPTRAELQAAGWTEEYGSDFDSGTWGFVASGGTTLSNTGGYLKFDASGSGGRSAARALPHAATSSKIYVIFDWRTPNSIGNSPTMFNVGFQDGSNNLLALRLGRQSGTWRIGAYSGPSNGPVDNWTGVQLFSYNSLSTWYRVGVLFDTSTQIATVTLVPRDDAEAVPSVLQVPFNGMQIGSMNIIAERASQINVSVVDCGVDNLWFFTAPDTPDTIESIIPYSFLPQLPETNNGTLQQSWSKTVYVGDVAGIEDLELPATVDVVTIAGQTHTVNVNWSLNETPRSYAGTGFDPTYAGIWTFAGTIEDIPDVASNNRQVPVPLIIDLRHEQTGYARSAEWLDRGVVAVPVTDGNGGGNLVSWRVLSDEYALYGADIAFNIYRAGVKLNVEPIVGEQNYIDNAGSAGDKYQVELIQTGELSGESAAWEQNYMTLNLQIPAERSITATDSANNATVNYTANDVAVGDVDGDGQYELLVKWMPTMSQDPGLTARITGETIYDCYALDGRLLWRINLGHNLTAANQHTNLRNFFDVDEDGRAEVSLKTAVGTRIFHPKADGTIDDLNDAPVAILAAVNDDGAANAEPEWRIPEGPVHHQTGYIIYTGGIQGTVGSSRVLGRVQSGPEWFTVFDGQTGLPIDTTAYFAPYGKTSSWGDTNSNRSDRMGATVAYLPYKGIEGGRPYPSMIEVRGHYGPHFVAAYQLIEGKLEQVWEFSLGANPATNPSYGNHQIAAADVNGDGYDEIIFGSIVLNSDGTILWAADGTRGSIRGTHGDALHVSVMTPDTDDIYIMVPQENFPQDNAKVYNAATGEAVWTITTGADCGRAVAANITPLPGFELWATEVPLHNIGNGRTISGTPNSTNFRIYWDGDLLSELLDGQSTPSVRKYNYDADANRGSNSTLQSLTGSTSNNGTKATPGIAVDLFGDWREEIIVRTTNNEALRIYSTDIPTDYLLYTLMHDPVYRLAVNSQGNVYNQPSHLGFYLGEDIRQDVLDMKLPIPNLEYTNAPPKDEAEITSVEVSPGITYLVTGFDAYIPVEVAVENADGLDVYVALYHDGEMISEEAKAVDGKARIFAEKVAYSAAVYVGARFEGAAVSKTADIAMKAVAVNLWRPECTRAFGTGNIGVIFAERIAPAAGGYVLTVNGMNTDILYTDDYRITFQPTPSGTAKISGVMYPELFPSYSFTFQVSIP